MRSAITLTTAMLALAISAHSASAQRTGGGGTIGCDPSLPSFQVSATNCRIFHKEALYGPAANPYAEGWVPERVIVRKKVVKPKKVRTRSTVSGSTGY
jgi:hypothetical protein